MNKLILPYALSLLLFVGASSSHSLDFDGDGISDITGWENQYDGSANEIALTSRLSSSGELLRREFGVSEEYPVPADYDGDGTTDLAVVGVQADGSLLWRYKLSGGDGSETSSSFGQAGVTVLGGCLFDDDSIADRSYVLQSTWYVERSSDVQTVTLDLGVANLQRFTCGDLDGDGIDELIAQGPLGGGSGRRAKFYGWNLLSGKVFEERFGKDVSAIFSGDVDGDGVAEVGFRRGESSSRRAIFYNNGTSQVLDLPNFLAIDFGTTSSGYGFMLKTPRDDVFLAYPSVQSLEVSEQVVLPDTVTLLPNVNVWLVGPSQSSEAACQVNEELHDGANGFLWKPVSHTQGNVVVLTDRSLKYKNMRVVKDGALIHRLRDVTYGPGSRSFFRASVRYTFFSSFSTLMATGNDGLTHCWLIPDPSQRYD